MFLNSKNEACLWSMKTEIIAILSGPVANEMWVILDVTASLTIPLCR
jgi:hypothetical protein